MRTSGFLRIVLIAAGSASLAACSAGSPPTVAPVAEVSQQAVRSTSQDACLPNAHVYPRPSLLGERLQTPSPCNALANAERRAASVTRRPLNASTSEGITTFDAPGVASATTCGATELFFDCGTQAAAINDSRMITGFYLDSTLRGTAFIRTFNGTFTTFQAPGAGGPHAGTSPSAVTDGGVIGGSLEDAQFVSHSFVRARDGTFLVYDPPFASLIPNASGAQGSALTSFDVPEASESDAKRFEAAGDWYDAQSNAHAYIRFKTGGFADATPPQALSAGVCPTDCFSLGEALGNFTNSSGTSQGYTVTHARDFAVLNVPNALFEEFSGINARGKVTGFYIDTTGVAWGFIENMQGKLTAFQAPDASVTSSGGTEAAQINDFGAVTGIFYDAGLVAHGFYRSPSGRMSEFDPSGSVATLPQAINDRGDVAGIWYDAQGQSHGFLWMNR